MLKTDKIIININIFTLTLFTTIIHIVYFIFIKVINVLCSRADEKYLKKIEILTTIPTDVIFLEVSGLGIK